MMVRREYVTPTTIVVRMEQEDMLCSSGWEVITPGEPDATPGSRDFEMDFEEI